MLIREPAVLVATSTEDLPDARARTERDGTLFKFLTDTREFSVWDGQRFMLLGSEPGDVLRYGSDLSAAQEAFGVSGVGNVTFTAGTYTFSSNYTPAAQDIALRIDPAASFPSGKLQLNNFVPFQATPVASLDLVRKTFDSSWEASGNIFMRAAYAVSEVDRAVVAVFGAGEATADNGSIWGGNFVAYARNATATAIGVEINCGADTAGGTAYGLVIASANTQPCTAALQIQSNTAASQFATGISFNFRDPEGCVTGTVFEVDGAGSSTVDYIIRATGISGTIAELDLPSFAVYATEANTVNRLGVKGAATGVNPRIQPTGTDADIGIDIIGKGTAGVTLGDGSANAKIKVTSTGVGFHGSAPVAKPTITGSRGGNAALASLLTALASMGLVTDSTTA